jgi:signal transduction histidine kinase
MDLLPEFRQAQASEREWLSALDVDVYVPICTHTKWIGLFALGVKATGARYSKQDLGLLSTLADQSVVALENARLVTNLEKLNRDLAGAYTQLEDANRELKELDELKSSFIGVVTHEMRTPLANVGMSLQIFERFGLDRISSEQREQLNQIKHSLSQVSVMIDNLVMLANFLNSQVKLRSERLNLKDILRDVYIPLKKMADEKGLELKVDIFGELLPIQADRKLLANAIYQLTHNAIKFTPGGGKVWISCWATNDAVCFDVKDTGIGIPADKIKSMWNEFTQMADPLKRGAEGLGLGLALVKYIVAAHGGEAWAESQQGAGSVFGFQIPTSSSRQAKRIADIFRARVEHPKA